MSRTTLASMIVEDIQLRTRPCAFVKFKAEPMDCDHLWEPHLWETGRAYCAQCGSNARWPNDPRGALEAVS